MKAILLCCVFISNIIRVLGICTYPDENSNLCLLCSYQHFYSGISINYDGGYLFSPIKDCVPKVMGDGETLDDSRIFLEYFILPLNCSQSGSNCTGTIADPFENLVTAFNSARTTTFPYFNSEITFFLLSDENGSASSPFFIKKTDFISEFLYAFRSTTMSVTIKPLYCYERQVKFCIKEETFRPTILITTETFFFFSMRGFRVENIIFDASDVTSKNLNSENTKIKICEENHLNDEWSANEKNSNETVCGRRNMILSDRGQEYGFINSEGNLDSNLAANKIVITNCTFNYFHTFEGENSWGSLIRSQNLNFSLVLSNVSVYKSYFRNGVVVADNDIPIFYRRTKKMAEQFSKRGGLLKNSNYIQLVNVSLQFYNYFNETFDAKNTDQPIFLKLKEIWVKVLVKFCSFQNNRGAFTSNKPTGVLFRFSDLINDSNFTLINCKIISNILGNFLVALNIISPFVNKLIINIEGVNFQFNHGAFVLIGVNFNFGNNYMDQFTSESTGFFTFSFVNIEIKNSTFLGVNSFRDSSFIRFETKALYSDKELFEDPISNEYLLHDTLKFDNSSLINSNISFLFVDESINSILISRSIFFKTGFLSLNFMEGSVESLISLSNTILISIKANIFQELRLSRNISLLNNIFMTLTMSKFMETSIFSSSDVGSYFELKNNLFFKISLTKGGFSFSGVFVKSAKIYNITNNVFFKVDAQKYVDSMFNLLYIYASVKNNVVLFLSNADFLRGNSHPDIKHAFFEIHNLVFNCSQQKIGYILNVNNFKKLIIQEAFLTGNSEKITYSMNALSFRSYIGSLSIIRSFFQNLQTFEGAISISIANIGSLKIIESIFRNNEGIDLSGDIRVETMENIGKYNEIDNFEDAGIYNNIFINSKGKTGGSITFLSGSEIFLSKCVFLNTEALASGGAIYFENKVQAILSSSIFFNSTSHDLGGILYTYTSDITLFNLTIQDAAAQKGGAFFFENSNLRIKHIKVINSHAEFGGGIFSSSSFTYIFSLFTKNNSAEVSGGCLYQTRGTLNLKTIYMNGCYGKFSGGCIHLEFINDLAVFKLYLSNSTVLKDGIFSIISKPSSLNKVDSLYCNKNAAGGIGACLIIRSGRSILENIEISSCRSFQAAVYIYSLSDKLFIKIINFKLINNYFETHGILLEKTECEIVGLFSRENRANESRTEIYFIKIINSNIGIENFTYFGAGLRGEIFFGQNVFAVFTKSVFDFYSKGGGITCHRCSSFLLFHVKIMRARIDFDGAAGGGLKVHQTPTTLIDCIFTNIIVNQGGAISVLDSNFSIINSTFIDGFSEKGESLILVSDEKIAKVSKLLVKNSSFLEGKGSLFDVRNIFGIEIENCTFFQNVIKSSTGKALNFDSNSEIIINFVEISNFLESGAITIKYSDYFRFENSIVSNSHSVFSGGGVYLDSVGYSLINSSAFLNNSARIDGGAVYYKCPQIHCVLIIENSKFKYNHADRYGAALKSEDRDAIISASNSMSDNYSPTKTEVSSFPSKVYYLIDGSYSLDLGILVSGRATNLTFELVDSLNKTFFYDNDGRMEFISYSENGEAISFQNEKAAIFGGKAVYTDFSIVAQPGRSYRVGILYSNDLTGKSFLQNLTLTLRKCIRGEILSGDICVPCKINFYSLEKNPMEKNNSFCKACPANAHCPGGSVILPKGGFWIKDENQSFIIECAHKESCPDRRLFGQKEFNATLCSVGFTGNLCYLCEKGYGKFSGKECVKCSDSIWLYIRFGFMSLISFSLLAYQAHAAFNFTTIESKRRSLIKIVVDHISYISFISRFNINWDSIIFLFFSVNDQYLTTVPKELFNFECFIDQICSGEEKFLANSVLVSITPYFYGCICLGFLYFFYGLLRLEKRFCPAKKKKLFQMTDSTLKPSVKIESMENFTKVEISITNSEANNKKTVQKRISAMSVIIFYNFYPRILINGLQFMKCIKIDETEDLYLEAYPDLKCWQKDHVKYLLFILIPNFLVWGCLIPILFYLLPKIMINRSRKLGNSEYHSVTPNQPVSSDLLSFLVLDFKDKYYFWEVFTYLFKFIIAVFMVITSRFAPLSQGALLIFFFLGLFLIHEHFKPFRYPFINNFKTYSLMTTICTSALAILSSDQNQSKEQSLVYLLCLLILNICFYAFWTYYFFHESIKLTAMEVYKKIHESLKKQSKKE